MDKITMERKTNQNIAASSSSTSSSNHATNNNTTSKIIMFQLLDPTLRLLLSSIEQLNSIWNQLLSIQNDDEEEEEENYHNNSKSQKNKHKWNAKKQEWYQRNKQSIILLYKTQASLFERLEADIYNYMNNSNANLKKKKDSTTTTTTATEVSSTSSMDANNIRIALYEMQEYITLPILLCLHQFYEKTCLEIKQIIFIKNDNGDENNTDDANNTANGENDNIAIVIQSSTQKSIECASSCLVTYVKCIHCHNVVVDGDSDGPLTIMNTNRRIKCIVAVTMTITCILESKQFCYHHRHLQKAKPLSDLDKGDDCLQALFTTLHTLLLKPFNNVHNYKQNNSSKTNQIEQTFIHEFETYIDNGGLIVGIVQNSLQCLDDKWVNNHHHHDNNLQNQQHDIDNNNSNIHHHNNHPLFSKRIERKDVLRDNIELKLKVLTVMKTLLELSSSRSSNSQEVKQISQETVFQKIFPTFFGILFKQLHLHLRFSTPTSSPKLAVRYIKVLSLLLNKTLTTPQSKESDSIREDKNLISDAPNGIEVSTKKFMVAISNIKTKTKNNNIINNSKEAFDNDTESTLPRNGDNDGDNSRRTDEINVFIENVKQRIPFPLSVLCKLISTHKLTKVRVAGIQFLCKCILVDTFAIWEEHHDESDNEERELNHSSKSLVENAFECLVIMMDDTNPEVSESSYSIFDLYQSNQIKNTVDMKMNHARISNIILEHILSLPTTARSLRERDLRIKMNIISGYITLLFKMDSSSSKKKKMTGSNYFMQKLMSNPYKKSLSDLFFLEEAPTTKVGSSSSPGQQLKYMREDTFTAAKIMLHKLSRLLGPRRSVLFADECIADIFDSLSDRIQTFKHSVCDKNHFFWIQHHFGLVVIATELVRGYTGVKMMKKRDLKLFLSFSQSILPVVLGEFIWQLPTNHKWTSSIIPYNNNLVDDPHGKSLISIKKLNDIVVGNKHQGNELNVYAASLNGNALLQMSLIDMIVALSKILGSDFGQFMPVVICPFLQKMCDINCVIVQEHTRDAIASLSQSLGFKTSDDMLSYHFRYIIETFEMELRTFFLQSGMRQQVISFYSLHTVVNFILQSVLEKKKSNHQGKYWSENDDAQVMVLLNLLQTINNWFNRSFSKRSDNMAAMMVPLSMLNVFDICFHYLDCLLGDYCKWDQDKPAESSSNWSNLLVQFELTEETNSGHDPQNETISSSSSTRSEEKNQFVSGEFLDTLVLVIKQVMVTLSTLMTVSELKLQKVSCDVLIISFRLLHKVQSLSKKLNNGDDNELGNPLLEVVSKHWYAIASQFKYTTQSIYLNDEHTTARIHLAYLFSSLLGVISVSSELCKEFIADKFEKTIFPQMSKLFQMFLLGEKAKQFNTQNFGIKEQFSKEDQIILASLLDCIGTVFVHSGEELVNMVPIVGSIVLPFLAIRGSIGKLGREAMEALVRIDCDCLWRPLLIGSGQNLPIRPLLSRQLYTDNSFEVMPVINTQTLYSERCSAILRLIENLPEQNII